MGRDQDELPAELPFTPTTLEGLLGGSGPADRRSPTSRTMAVAAILDDVVAQSLVQSGGLDHNLAKC